MRLTRGEHLALAAQMKQRAPQVSDPELKADYLKKHARFQSLAKLAGKQKFPVQGKLATVTSLKGGRRKP